MNAKQELEKELVIVNSDLSGANGIIFELDRAIQDTGNLELSKTLNEILDSYESLRELLNRKKEHHKS
jgi:hypothetical protein